MESNTIGTRLESFLKSKFGDKRGWLTKAATALGMDSSGVKKYINNEFKPGPIMQDKLRELKCDIEWLMTGETKSADRVREKEIEYYKSENEKLKQENDALKRSLAPHLVQTVLESINYKPVRKKKQ